MTQEVSLQNFVEFTRREGLITRALSPENKLQCAWARAADRASLEALNPEDLTHNAMSEKQLAKWMQGDDHHMTRFLIVEPKKFGEFVDLKEFDKAVAEAQAQGQEDHMKALLEMKTLGVVGFTYLYNDAHRDEDFVRRADEVRTKEGLQGNHSVWEMNIWNVPGARDKHVQRATADTLQEFSRTRARETTTVMFADSGDLREAYEQAVSKHTTLKELSRASNRSIAEGAFQDTRVLHDLGFHLVDRMRYDDTKRPLDFAYACRITPPPKV